MWMISNSNVTVLKLYSQESWYVTQLVFHIFGISLENGVLTYIMIVTSMSCHCDKKNEEKLYQLLDLSKIFHKQPTIMNEHNCISILWIFKKKDLT